MRYFCIFTLVTVKAQQNALKRTHFSFSNNQIFKGSAFDKGAIIFDKLFKRTPEIFSKTDVVFYNVISCTKKILTDPRSNLENIKNLKKSAKYMVSDVMHSGVFCKKFQKFSDSKPPPQTGFQQFPLCF